MPQSKHPWRPSWVTCVAGVLIVGGILLTNVSWWFLLLTAVGTLGPGILREAGWLNDQDEEQRQIARRAGYHAYLVTAAMAFLLIVLFRWTGRDVADPEELAHLFLAVLWFSWCLSWLIGSCGARVAVFRMLVGFGFAWFAFAVVSNLGQEWNGWVSLLLHPLLVAPFFALAWLSTRFPKMAGMLLLAVALFFMQFFGLLRYENLSVLNQAVTFVLFIGPLAAGGMALLTSKKSPVAS